MKLFFPVANFLWWVKNLRPTASIYSHKSLRIKAVFPVVWYTLYTLPSNLRVYHLKYAKGLRLIARSETRSQSTMCKFRFGAVFHNSAASPWGWWAISSCLGIINLPNFSNCLVSKILKRWNYVKNIYCLLHRQNIPIFHIMHFFTSQIIWYRHSASAGFILFLKEKTLYPGSLMFWWYF